MDGSTAGDIAGRIGPSGATEPPIARVRASTPLTLATIVATIGPASESPECVRKLIDAGVGVFRLNFSHGTLDDHAKRLRTIREAAKEMGRTVAVLGDLQGPKIRVGKIEPAEGVAVGRGDDVVLCSGPGVKAERTDPHTVVLPCAYAALPDEVEPGHRVLINDGAIRMLAVERHEPDPARSVRCRVIVGGTVTSSKGLNLPDSDVAAPAVTDRDWQCVEWAVAHGLDFLALSFVREADEVIELRRRLATMCPVEKPGAEGDRSAAEGAAIPVVAKIEKPQALDDIDAIVAASDAIMVARGDLGVEMELAQVPLIQKRLIAKADEWGKPCIVATQMLETMITASAPTRAEASDVANAVLDGADAVMLSAETASGEHPVLVVETMRRIVAAAEERVRELSRDATPPARLVESKYRTAALAHGAWYVARDIGATLVVCWSQRGGTARFLSRLGFRVPIIAYSSDERETRRMALLKGVTPVCMPGYPRDGATLAEWNAEVDRGLVARGWARHGDPIVLLAGMPLGRHAATNTLAVHYVGNPSLGYLAH